MSWRPSRKQLEIIAEHAAARTAPTRIVTELGIDEATFGVWNTKMLAARALSPTEIDALIYPMPDIARARREHAQMVGERLFEGEQEDDAA